jgi:hypothetical protein
MKRLSLCREKALNNLNNMMKPRSTRNDSSQAAAEWRLGHTTEQLSVFSLMKRGISGIRSSAISHFMYK